MIRVFATCILVLLSGAVAHAQIKPETSGKSSFYEPEGNPHGKGWVRPNMPGRPSVFGRGHRREHSIRSGIYDR